MADEIGDAFARAVEALGGIGGRVVVTGMGKSGHIARKIAATMASTGTPAQFVHPAEASHGDLGMVTRADALLALSNSGNTAELGDVLAYAKRLALPIVAITARAPSALADAATETLLLPNAEEACPMGLAPTTSTTATMAMGDALAVALLERRGFSAEQFRALHPGGTLGRRLLLVRDVMHADLPLVQADTPMSQALVAMTAKSFGCVGVCAADGSLAGIVTDGDLRRHMSSDLLERPAGAIMTANPLTIRAQALAVEALALMNDRQVTSLFVLPPDADAGAAPIGIIHIHDCLRAGLS
ncbi:MAG: KpsF/GutQ family sugar-phosphate isomerase [Alphaproteobacteria bacterium]|nr:KpsF/GutQ family sugar-phosphate isomerase [Alphaproteobacteria bacterium]